MGLRLVKPQDLKNKFRMMFEIFFETMFRFLNVFRMSQKDGAKVVIIFDSANTFAKKMLRKVLLSVF